MAPWYVQRRTPIFSVAVETANDSFVGEVAPAGRARRMRRYERRVRIVRGIGFSPGERCFHVFGININANVQHLDWPHRE